MPLYLYAFGIYKITPREDSKREEAPTGFLIFLRDIFHAFDVLGYLIYREGEDVSYSEVVTSDSKQKVKPNDLQLAAYEHQSDDDQVHEQRPGQSTGVSIAQV